jgi:hypothetical protein
MSTCACGGAGVLAVAAFVAAFRLMAYVDDKVNAIKPRRASRSIMAP